MYIGGVLLNSSGPSTVSSQQLYCWTKFLTGEPHHEFRYGAVKPPVPTCNWLPAAIGPETVFIASTRTFRTAEAAVEWLRAAGG